MKLGGLFSKAAKVGAVAKEHDSAIMAAVSIGGMIAAVVSAFRKADKAKEILADEDLTTGEKAKELGKELWPVAVGAVASTAGTLGLYKKNQNLGKLLTAAVSTTTAVRTLLDETEKKLTEVVGDEKAEEIKKEVQKKAGENTGTVNVSSVPIVGNGDTIFRNPRTGFTVKATKDYIRSSIKTCNLWMAQQWNFGGVPDEDSYLTLGDIDRTIFEDPNGVPETSNAMGYNVRNLGRRGEIRVGFAPWEYENPVTHTTELGYLYYFSESPVVVPPNATHMGIV